MESSVIRQKFLEYFRSHGHTIIASSSLVPASDPTLLFTNAGMVQFKDVFLGQDQRNYVRATSSQRCVRAGGKHNDLDNVGYTARHHTFFEMLGNFSFGDYFKRDAIQFAWEFLTEVLKIPAEKLWVTVYSEDEEAANIWISEIGINASQLVRVSTSDNFWQMGDTGPCGPCSEIFYDHGPTIAGTPPGTKDADNDRFIEIWNLVFMQFDRDSEGTLRPLPRPSVDTGMGLERIAAVMQQVHSNYDTDLFKNLIQAAARVTNTQDLSNNSLKVIADHIRACAFLITDGVIPSSEGRGYVLRRIIRRAIRHGYRLKQKQPFLFRLVKDLTATMGQAYPELITAKQQVTAVLKKEEQRFSETLENGMQVLESALQQATRTIDGETAFRLYDTFGFPLDLTADILRERGIAVDYVGFERAMSRQRKQARAASKFTIEDNISYSGQRTEFFGYSTLQHEGYIQAIYKQGNAVKFITEDDAAVIVLDKTAFYAESGGQAGDCGDLLTASGTFAVLDTQKIQAGVFGHKGFLRSGKLAINDKILTRVDPVTRSNTAKNHSATHLLHAALRQVLGHHVMQKGSLVDANRARFDFSHQAPVSTGELQEIERLVNEKIRYNPPIETQLMTYDDAIKHGAIALLDEKYTDEVRVVSMDKFSIELCGGTHVTHSGDIGFFKIISESGVAAGIRRIEAITGKAAIEYIQKREKELLKIARALKTSPQEAAQKLSQLVNHTRQIEKELTLLKSKLTNSQSNALHEQACDINGIKVLTAHLEGANINTLRETLDKLKDKLKSCIVVLATIEANKVILIAGITTDLTKKAQAGELVNFVAKQVGGKGGGRAGMAQAGGIQPENLPAALDSVISWARKKMI